MIVIRQNDNKDNERIVSFDPPLMGSHINSDFKHFLFENGDFQAKKIKIRPQTIGVLEIFKDNEKKVYTTSRTSCNCSFRVEHQAPCRHIIFIRSMDDESDVFSVDMFHERYHRIEFNPLSAEPVEEELTNGFTDLDAEEETMSDTDIGDDPDDLHNLSDTEKFKHVMPILLKIGNLISKHSTNDFYGYIEDLEDFEKAIRRRQRYRISSSMSSAEEEEISENLTNPASSSTMDTCTSPGPSSATSTSQPSNADVNDLEHDSS